MRGGSKQILIAAIAVIAILAWGCEPKPQPIEYGSDGCAYCRMMISDAEFGSQVLNNQGRSFKFDSVECMAAYDITEEGENIHSRWVPDFLNRENWLEADKAYYLHSETLRSPMGLFLSAYSTLEDAERMRDEYGGRIIGYDEVKEIVKQEWLENNSGHEMHH
jgi:copper chaperone NosL